MRERGVDLQGGLELLDLVSNRLDSDDGELLFVSVERNPHILHFSLQGNAVSRNTHKRLAALLYDRRSAQQQQRAATQKEI